MVSAGDDGVIFSVASTGTFTLYSCDVSTGVMATVSVTIDNTAQALTGAQKDSSTKTFTNTELILQ